jgi:hypothetical protein
MPVIQGKKNHRLHESQSAEDFIARLELEAGSPSLWHPKRFVEAETLEGLVLGGSIPLGIGSSASDVDLIAVVKEPTNLPAAFPTDEAIVYAARRDGGAHVILVSNHVEIDINFVAMSRILAIFDNAQGAGGLPPTSDMRLLARLRRGWVLSANDAFARFIEVLRNNQTINIRCCVATYIYALQSLDDARAALTDNLPLALHLGRLCVEWAMQSYFASLGELYVGDKWLRLLRRGVERSQLISGQALSAQAERLLFPALDLADDRVCEYLRDVGMFALTIKQHIERDPAFRIAFRLCPQIEDPIIEFSQ